MLLIRFKFVRFFLDLIVDCSVEFALKVTDVLFSDGYVVQFA